MHKAVYGNEAPSCTVVFEYVWREMWGPDDQGIGGGGGVKCPKAGNSSISSWTVCQRLTANDQTDERSVAPWPGNDTSVLKIWKREYMSEIIFHTVSWMSDSHLLYQSTHSQQHRNLRRPLGGSSSNLNKSQGRERRTISSPRSTNFALNKNDIDQSFLKNEGWSTENLHFKVKRVKSGFYSQVLDSLLKRIARVKPWLWFTLLDNQSALCVTYCSVYWRIAVWLTSTVHLNHLTSPQRNTFY